MIFFVDRWSYFHDDDCGELLEDRFCPKCGFVVDLQSIGARRRRLLKKTWLVRLILRFCYWFPKKVIA